MTSFTGKASFSHIRFRRWWLTVAIVLLTACSGSRELSLTQDQFQALVNEGFPGPRIVTVDLPATARAHLYLQTPRITFADSRSTVNWVIPGEVDVDFAGQFSTGRMTMELHGSSALELRGLERGVFLSDVKISGKDISVQSNLVQLLVLDALAQIVAEKLNGLLLFVAPESSALGRQLHHGAVYRIEPGIIQFSPDL